MMDLKTVSEILVNKGKVRGKPVAISLFKDSIPQGYEPIESEPCSIIHYAMDEGKKVYFDAEHYDCLVGVHHAGMIPGKREIVSGEYLSTTSSFFSYEGAARLKSGTRNLPPGMVKAIGAAPLDQVPNGVHVDRQQHCGLPACSGWRAATGFVWNIALRRTLFHPLAR
jgi:uncharacterized protein (DUF169 family)